MLVRPWHNAVRLFIMLDFSDIYDRSKPIIIAHRGASAAKRENTLEAFEIAIEMKADAIEMDIRRTADGVLVVHHDPTISDSGIAALTYRELDSRAGALGYHIPTLEETLKYCAGRIALDIELKETGYEGDIIPLVGRYYEPANVVFTSFRDSTVGALKKCQPSYRAGLLLGWDTDIPLGKRLTAPFPTSRLKKCGADFAAPHYKLARASFIDRMNAAGFPVLAWTVDDPEIAFELVEYGVAGIITNTPDRLKVSL